MMRPSVRKIVGARVETRYARVSNVCGADQDHRRETRCLAVLQLRAHIESGKARHDHVEQHHVRLLLLDDSQRVVPVRCRQHFVSDALKQQAKPRQIRFEIVDDQDSSSRAHGEHTHFFGSGWPTWCKSGTDWEANAMAPRNRREPNGLRNARVTVRAHDDDPERRFSWPREQKRGSEID